MTGKHQFVDDLPNGQTAELLIVLMEECGEIIQRTSKAMRFGLREIQPGQDLDNVQRLSMELGDLTEVLERLHNLGAVDLEYVEKGKEHKKKQLAKYLKHQ